MVGRAWQPGGLKHTAETSQILADGKAEGPAHQELFPETCFYHIILKGPSAPETRPLATEPVLNWIDVGHVSIHKAWEG